MGTREGSQGEGARERGGGRGGRREWYLHAIEGRDGQEGRERGGGVGTSLVLGSTLETPSLSMPMRTGVSLLA